MSDQPRRLAWVVPAIVGAVFVLHIIGDSRYGFFEDELYFIVCGWHLAWGYVDQPPLVALVSLLGAPFHYALIPVRILPSLAAALAAWFASRSARELGGGIFAQAFTALGVALIPVYLVYGSLLTTTSWEPLSWTIAIYLVLRIIRGADPRLWLLLGLDVAFGLYGKYTIALLILALVAGLLLTPQRRVLATPWAAAGFVLVCVLVAPNFLWQAAHGFPFLEVIHNDEVRRHALLNGVQVSFVNFWQNALAFTVEQIVLMHPFLAPVWIAGLVVLTRRVSAAFLIAYLFLVAIALADLSKGYYIMGVYASLIGAGSVAFEGAARKWQRTLAVALVTLPMIAAIPLLLPILPIHTFIAYTRALHLANARDPRVVLIQPEYADEFGWRATAKAVADVYNRLPPAERARTAVFADQYGYAAALDIYGPAYGLPQVISPHNSFYLWGTGGYDGSRIVAVGATDYPLLVKYFRSVKQVAVVDVPLRHVLEGPLPIYLVTDPVMPFNEIWKRLRDFGP